ncbi:hypothetical protein VKT23_008617 [Stygiomarasmius scandens]|uniref:Uncharacterized protein n=1 Tax=Marasmiellus scandens TaxID=2682957 RepID=A0ABR1JN23_9AGAR
MSRRLHPQNIEFSGTTGHSTISIPTSNGYLIFKCLGPGRCPGCSLCSSTSAMPVSSQTRSATTPRRSNAKPTRSKPSSSKEIPNTFQFQLELNETHRDGSERIQPVNMTLKNSPERYVPYPEHVAFAFGYPPHSFLVGCKPPSRFPLDTSIVFERAQKQNASPQFGLLLSDCLLLGVHENNVDIRLPDWPVFSQDYVRNLKEPKVFWELVWPGYLHTKWCVSIPIQGRNGLLTRRELGYIIASEYKKFIEASLACMRGDFQGREPNWRFSKDRYLFEDLKLTTFWNLTENVWRTSMMVSTRCSPDDGCTLAGAGYYGLSDGKTMVTQ